MYKWMDKYNSRYYANSDTAIEWIRNLIGTYFSQEPTSYSLIHKSGICPNHDVEEYKVECGIH